MTKKIGGTVAKETRDPLIQVPINFPKRLRDAARAKTLKTGIPLSHVVRKAVEQWVEEKPGQES